MSSHRRLSTLSDHVAAAPAASGLSISGLAPGVRARCCTALRFCSVLLFPLEAVRISRNPLSRTQAFTEVRKYPVKPGKMDEWVRIMEDMIIP